MNIKEGIERIRSYSESPSIVLDCFVERLFHGVGTEMYTVLDFASKSRRCRRNYLTQFDSRRMIQHLNVETSSKEDRSNIGNKYLFNKFFVDYVKRDWLYTSDSDEGDIEDFIAKHKTVLAKPIGLTKGEGIRLISKPTDLNEIGGGGTVNTCWRNSSLSILLCLS